MLTLVFLQCHSHCRQGMIPSHTNLARNWSAVDLSFVTGAWLTAAGSAEGRCADTQDGRGAIPKGAVMIGVVFDLPAGIGDVTFWPWTWWNSFATWWNQF
ncbi:hypothetical protein OPAG_07381 [Rhodococcus opacus PD630]|nr:hypothetical protein Pd630_LPD07889 [Rhodococcus opacus PD630]EHI41649.1 hypothetical protein OPAG_07381 [Rhodococcus opacus PD630]